MIRLYDYWRSSAAYRVRIALHLAGLDWDSVPIDLAKGAHAAPDHLARNPQGKVPVIEIDGHVLTQSLAIVEYLDETRDLGLLPSAPADRARCRAIAHAIAMDIHPVCNLSVARFATESSGGALEMGDWMARFITPGLAAVEKLVDDGTHCLGDRVTLADICLVPQIYNARRWDVELPAMPRLMRIADHLHALPAFQAAHPDLAPR